MYTRMQKYSEKELTRIHDASMDLLKNTGVAFNDDEALGIFRKKWFKGGWAHGFFLREQCSPGH